MAERAKHAFGSLADVQAALDAGKIDAYDILFLDGDTSPKVGWIDKNGIFRLVENEADVSELEKAIATKISAEEVDTKINKASADTVATANSYTDGKVEAAINEHMVKKYEITSIPEGTLVDYRDKEIRIFCPKSTVWTKQSVGEGGDPNCYYATLRTYVSNDNAVGYIEHLGDQVDAEILTDIKTDENGRRYQDSWLALARYDEATNTWTYYGANSNAGRYIGWDYQLDLFDADGVMIGSNSVRIGLANEDCYFVNTPYYVGAMEKKIEEKIAEIETKIEESESSIEIVEF